MKYKVGDKVRIKTNLTEYESDRCHVTPVMAGMEGQVHIIEEISPNHNYKIFTNDGCDYWWFSEEMLEPADNIVRMADGTIIGDFSTGGFCDGFRGGKIPTPSKPVSIEEQFGLPKGVSIHDLDMTSLYRPMNIEIQPLELVCNEEQAKNIAERLAEELNGMLGVSFTKKEEKKMPTKFTFYTTEGYRMDKSNNTKIPTMTTEVLYKDKDGCAKGGSATCDKADYDERQGCLEALANMCCGGNFDKEYDKAVKKNKLIELHDRTCTYCGKVFDTVEELKAEEAWHVERKKARRERYLLRKRAKEIAFEEQARKIAKEMIKK